MRLAKTQYNTGIIGVLPILSNSTRQEGFGIFVLYAPCPRRSLRAYVIAIAPKAPAGDSRKDSPGRLAIIEGRAEELSARIDSGRESGSGTKRDFEDTAQMILLQRRTLHTKYRACATAVRST